MKDEAWVMKSGEKIMVNDMDESHAKSCLRLMIRRVREHNLAILNNKLMNNDESWNFDDAGDR